MSSAAFHAALRRGYESARIVAPPDAIRASPAVTRAKSARWCHRHCPGARRGRPSDQRPCPVSAWTEEETMIPGAFSYHRPVTVADAVKLLADLGDDARPLAGGHSLGPMMKLRLATPAHLVDLHGVADLKGIKRDGNKITIGAMTTQHELLASAEIAKSLPILHEAALLIAD